MVTEYNEHPILVETADGSKTLFLNELDEQYHSLHGAATESEHVFIRHGLLAKVDKPCLTILEVGFGTGLNCLLTLLNSNLKIRYVTLEKYVLSKELVDRLGYEKLGGGNLFRMIHAAPWNTETPLTPDFSLLKLQCDLLDIEPLPIGSVDLVYYDAFGPDKQPDMWTDEVVGHVVGFMAPGAVLVTYTAKGEVRRRFQRLGLTAERLPGPPGKREMLRAIKPELKAT